MYVVDFFFVFLFFENILNELSKEKKIFNRNFRKAGTVERVIFIKIGRTLLIIMVKKQEMSNFNNI